MTWSAILDLLAAAWGSGILRAALIVTVGFAVAVLVSRGVAKAVAHHTQAEQPRILRRLIFYTVALVFLVFALGQLGFDVGVLLGAAGVLTVAVGFAAQTSFSNIISGLFLVGERPFKEGDFISTGEVSGTVHTIDLLAVTLRTADNLAVRVPNETLIKAPFTNFSRFPIRRIDLIVQAAYGEDLQRVLGLIVDTVRAHPRVLEEPAERVFFEGYGDSSVLFKVTAWVERDNFFDTKRELGLAIRMAFTREGIEVPYPKRTVHFVAPPVAPAPVDVPDEVTPGEVSAS